MSYERAKDCESTELRERAVLRERTVFCERAVTDERTERTKRAVHLGEHHTCRAKAWVDSRYLEHELEAKYAYATGVQQPAILERS